MVNHHEWQELLEALLPAVYFAGRCLENYRHQGVVTEAKPDGSPVSVADREAEDILVKALMTIMPEVPIIGEEAASSGHAPMPGEICFYVDALDGTRGFLDGSVEYTINIGMVRSSVPVFGLVYAPAIGRLFVTLDKDHAVEMRVDLLGADDGSLRNNCQQITTRRPAQHPIRMLASESSNPRRQSAFAASFPDAVQRFVRSSLKFCLIACGEADTYARFGPTSYWDIIAGHAVLLAAGGQVTRLDGSSLEYPGLAGRYTNENFVAWGDPNQIAPISSEP